MEDLALHHHHRHHRQSQHQPHPQPLPSPSTPPGNMLNPTWHGIVMTTLDALTVVEACLSGVLMHTARRPHDREREHLIRSGNVFVYEESSSGIKRWTDGQNWSPSRILGNYLIYRELEKNFPPGDKKRAIKRKRDCRADSQQYGHSSSTGTPASLSDERERALLGSLVDSYPFKEGGLIKKTISIKWNNVMHHLVSYYSLEDARNHRLPCPHDDPKLAHITPRPELVQHQEFRVPAEQEDPRFLEDRAIVLGMIPHAPYSQTPTLERNSLPQIANRTMSNPYNTTHFPMSIPVPDPMGSGMPMSNHYGSAPTSYVSWDQQRSRAPPLQLHAYGSNMSHLMDSNTKRRRSGAYDATTPDGHEIFSPMPDPTRTSQNYYTGTTASFPYSMAPLPPASDTPDYRSPGPNIASPPSTSTARELSWTPAVSYTPVSMQSSMDYPTMTTATSPPPLTSNSFAGQVRGDQFFAPFSSQEWNGTGSDSGSGANNEPASYLLSRPINGWRGVPHAGSHE